MAAAEDFKNQPNMYWQFICYMLSARLAACSIFAIGDINQIISVTIPTAHATEPTATGELSLSFWDRVEMYQC